MRAVVAANPYLLVFVGSGIGGMLRHFVNLTVPRALGSAFPYHTLTVNVVGSLIMGLVAGYFAAKGDNDSSQAWKLFIATGILGGFTTFSAFSLDVAVLLERGAMRAAMLYVLASVGMSIGGLFVGLFLARHLSS